MRAGAASPFRRVGAPIGEGAYSTVFRCVAATDDTPHAMKRVDHVSADDHELLERELRVLKHLEGDGRFAQLVALQRTDDSAELVFTLADGDLHKLFKSDVDLSEHIHGFTTQLLDAVESLHARRVIHRDLKPANILVYGARLVLNDFGLACFFEDDARALDGRTSYVVTRWYRAPELLEQALAPRPDDVRIRYGAIIDEWALGCILAELDAARHAPLFPGRNDRHQLDLIRLSLASFATAEVREAQRITFLQSRVSHVHLRWAVDRLLREKPDERWTAGNVLVLYRAAVIERG